jgi:hypothetical protein
MQERDKLQHKQRELSEEFTRKQYLLLLLCNNSKLLLFFPFRLRCMRLINKKKHKNNSVYE